MKEPNKNMKIVYGPVHPVVEKNEIIKIPSEKAGEKRIITHIDLQKEKEEFLEIQANTHNIIRDNAKKIVKRIAENGTVLTEREEGREEGR